MMTLLAGLTGMAVFLACFLVIRMVIKAVISRNLIFVVKKYSETLHAGTLHTGNIVPPFNNIRIVCVALFVFIAVFLVRDVLLGIPFVLAGIIIPGRIKKILLDKKREKIDGQLVDFLGGLANSISAGGTLMQAINTASGKALPPLSAELAEVIREVRLGVSIDVALNSMSGRIGSSELNIAVVSMNVARQFGGNLASNLTGIVRTMRERKKLKNRIKALTSQGQLSAWTITLTPFLILVVLSLMEPAMFGIMFRTVAGKLILLSAMGMAALGNYIIMKIVTIEV
ncbi:MAG: type II secretion system F family protein [Elusimicrobia bacterium]|nr:type II secretion system F family protein [Elusimicrobiota bacterium]